MGTSSGCSGTVEDERPAGLGCCRSPPSLPSRSALDADLQWMVFIGVVSVIVLVPAIAYRSWEVMLPWELIGLATFPILVRGVIGGTVGTFATYLALAGLAWSWSSNSTCSPNLM